MKYSKIFIFKVVSSICALVAVSMTYNNCAVGKFQSGSIGDNPNGSIVGGTGNRFSCTGSYPANSSICYEDDLDLLQNSPRVVVSSCTSKRSCEYECLAGFYPLGGTCVSGQGNSCPASIPCNIGSNCSVYVGNPTAGQQWTMAPANSPTSVACSYTCNPGFTGNVCQNPPAVNTCQGNVPANATLCVGSNTNLSQPTNNSLVGSCTGAKCEYVCSANYNFQTNGMSGNSCALNGSGFRCPATEPCSNGGNCTLHSGSPASSAEAQSWTLVSRETTPKPVCSFSCNMTSTGPYTGANCQINPATYSCTGTIPPVTDAAPCAGYNTGLTANTAITAVRTCGTAKCQYTCVAGKEPNAAGTACVPIATTTNACSTTKPYPTNLEGTNFRTFTADPSATPPILPSQINQSWHKFDSVSAFEANPRRACSYVCINDFTGNDCLSGGPVTAVACADAQSDAGAFVTHWNNGFSLGANGVPTIANPSQTNEGAGRKIYNYGLLPQHDVYIGDNFELEPITDGQFNTWARSECDRIATAAGTGVPIEARKLTGAQFTDWAQAKTVPRENRGAIQVLYALISEKSLVTVMLPPGWKKTDPIGKYPIMFTTSNGLRPNMLAENHLQVQTLGRSWKTNSVPFIVVVWNASGSIGGRAAQSSMRSEVNTILQKVQTHFSGDAQRVFAMGASHAGLAALSLAAKPEGNALGYKVVAAYAGTVLGELNKVIEYTGTTVPGLMDTAEWSIGVSGTWKRDFAYPFGNGMSGWNRNDTHLYILAGSKDPAKFETDINLTSTNMINALRTRQTEGLRLYLEMSSHDFVIPWFTQLKLLKQFSDMGINYESRINYMAGNWIDTTSSEAVLNPNNLKEVMKKIHARTFDQIFTHGKKTQYLSDSNTSNLRKLTSNDGSNDTRPRFTLEIPRLQSQNAFGHFVITGDPSGSVGTEYEIQFTYTAPNSTPVAGTPISGFLNAANDGIVVSSLDGLAFGTYTITKVRIKTPGETNFRDVDFRNRTTMLERNSGSLLIEAFDDTQFVGGKDSLVPGKKMDYSAHEFAIAIMEHYLGPANENFPHKVNGNTGVTYGIIDP